MPSFIHSDIIHMQVNARRQNPGQNPVYVEKTFKIYIIFIQKPGLYVVFCMSYFVSGNPAKLFYPNPGHSPTNSPPSLPPLGNQGNATTTKNYHLVALSA